jgi:uncharacterized cupin superfamily protein
MTMTFEILSGLETRMPAVQLKPTSVDGQVESSVSIPGLRTGEVGLWECDEGTFTADRSTFAEVCYIIAGEAVIATDGASEDRAVSAGSLFVLPRGWRGTWTVREPVRKAFVLISDQSPA